VAVVVVAVAVVVVVISKSPQIVKSVLRNGAGKALDSEIVEDEFNVPQDQFS